MYHPIRTIALAAIATILLTGCSISYPFQLLLKVEAKVMRTHDSRTVYLCCREISLSHPFLAAARSELSVLISTV